MNTNKITSTSKKYYLKKINRPNNKINLYKNPDYNIKPLLTGTKIGNINCKNNMNKVWWNKMNCKDIFAS